MAVADLVDLKVDQMYFSFKKPEPPPKPIYKQKPIATLAVILSIIGMFVLGPVGAIYKGMTEELKTKANNETLLLYMKQQKEDNDRQWKEIERNRDTQQSISTPRNVKIVQPKAIKLVVKKLTPTEYVNYINMTPEQQIAYKKYRTDITVWP